MVDLEIWCETLRKYPLRYRFDGLDGYHTDVRQAAVGDDRFVERYIECEVEAQVKWLEEALADPQDDDDVLDEYLDFLKRIITIAELDGQSLPGGLHQNIEFLERVRPCRITEQRLEFASDRVFIEWDDVRDGHTDYLLKDHPPVEVWNEAYGMGFPVERVVYICPSCGRQAMTVDELQDNGFHHYCSMCGSEYMTPHDFRQPQDLQRFAEDLGVELWPFGQPQPLGPTSGEVQDVDN